jgi:4-hydroxy-2-oxoheptanedioate aldolase
MADLPRLNGIIGALESGRHAFSLFAPAEPETAIELQGSDYDGVVFEGEHRPWDPRHLRDTLQYLLNRGQIAKSGSVAPKVTPTARIPASGVEMNQFLAKQALDIGCYGVMWPHISTVEEAYNAVAACRYQRMKGKPLYEPAGIRGDGPVAAARYWGVSQQEYYSRADVWPLAPEGEILVVIQIEDTRGIENLDDMLKNVPGIGVVLIGEGDLSQELGIPRQYEHKDLLDAMAKIVDICKRHNVVVGHPHVTPANAERVVEEGYRYLMCAAPRSFAHLEKARAAAGLG